MHSLTMQHKYAVYNHLLIWCFLFSTPCAHRHGIPVSRAHSDLAAWECHVIDNIFMMCCTREKIYAFGFIISAPLALYEGRRCRLLALDSSLLLYASASASSYVRTYKPYRPIWRYSLTDNLYHKRHYCSEILDYCYS